METRRVTLRSGIALSVRDHPGRGVPVVCLHGLASNARWWDLVAERLAPEHRVVAVDQRGHGGSDRPDDGYDFASVAADALGVAGALGLGRFAVVGHSWGASVALSAAVVAAGSVCAVGCVDGGVGDLRRVFGPDWTVAEAAMRPPELIGISEADVRAMARRGGLAGAADPERAAEILLANFEPAATGGLRPRLRVDRHMAIARALYELDGAALLGRLPDIPVLVALATEGPIAMVEGKRAAADAAMAVLGARGMLRWIDGGHDLPVQRPAETAAAIRELLARAA